MKYSMNKSPMLEDPDRPPPQGPFEVWTKVYTRPGEQTFIEITSHPDAKARSAYIWVFIAGTLAGMINGLTQIVVGAVQLRNAAPDVSAAPGALGVIGLFTAICIAPLYGLFSAVAFAGGASIFHAAASFLGGKGSFDKLAYAFGAVIVPQTIFSALLIPFNAVSFLLFCTIPFAIGVSMYAWYLQVTAIKAVHQFGWAEAAGAYFTPLLLGVMSCAVLVLVGMRVAGMSFNQIMELLQQGVP